MNRKKLLLFHAIAAERHQSQIDWKNFLREASDLPLPDDAEILAPNVWLLPDDKRSYLLLSRLGQKHAIETRCLPFSSASDWQLLSSCP